MRVDLVLKNIRRTRVLGDVVEKDVEKIERHLKTFGDSPIHLEIRLERSLHKKEYEAWMGLYLPKKVLRAHEHSEDKLTCINITTKALIRQLEKVKTQMDRVHSKKRKGISEVAADSLEPEMEDFKLDEALEVELAEKD